VNLTRIAYNVWAKLGRRHAPKIEVVLGDITDLDTPVDVIVNAAKATLLGGGGVDGAIHFQGGPDILAQCKAIRASVYPDGLPVGDAVPTTAGRLDAKYVVHTVGPRWSDTKDRPLLHKAYIHSLLCADRLKAKTVAFPLISAGAYGWPLEDAILAAFSSMSSFRGKVDTVTLVLFDEDTYDLARRIYDRCGFWL
jgi:O-acetyl-ADP-ribose deacetylase (regulator of RNase III)